MAQSQSAHRNRTTSRLLWVEQKHNLCGNSAEIVEESLVFMLFSGPSAVCSSPTKRPSAWRARPTGLCPPPPKLPEPLQIENFQLTIFNHPKE
jgi:hypothetical protein